MDFDYPKKMAHGIMFHHFHDKKHIQGQGSISQETFDKILNHIGVKRFLSPDEWLARLKKNQLQNEDVCLTFDDGLLCQREIALPVLEHYNLKAFWFIYSSVFEGQLENLEIYRLFRTKYFEDIDDFYNLFFKEVLASEFGRSVSEALNKSEKETAHTRKLFPFYSIRDIQFRFVRDKVLGEKNYEQIMDRILEEYDANKSDLSSQLWMSNDDLKYLNDRKHVIGLHSYSHPTTLEQMSYQDQLEEYKKNFMHLKNLLHVNPLTMSHPCNSYNNTTLQVLRTLGIQCGFRSNMFLEQDDKPRGHEFEIAREDHANITRGLL